MQECVFAQTDATVQIMNFVFNSSIGYLVIVSHHISINAINMYLFFYVFPDWKLYCKHEGWNIRRESITVGMSILCGYVTAKCLLKCVFNEPLQLEIGAEILYYTPKTTLH